MSLPRLSVQNSVLANMLMILVIALGTFSLITLPRELFPQIRLNRVFIAVPFTGAGPEEVEKLITKPIEDEIKDVDHIDMLISKSSEGRSSIGVIFKSINERTFQRVYQELKNEVEKVDLPGAADDPVYFSLETSTWFPLAVMVVSGDLSDDRMRQIAEELEDELESLPGVDDVALAGAREREIWVEVDPDRIYRHNLSLEQVAGRIGRQNVLLPSGTVRVGEQEYRLRSLEEFDSLEDIAQVVVLEDSVGNHVRITDIAAIRDTYKEADSLSQLNGKRSVALNIFKAPEGNTLELIREFGRLAVEKELSLPQGVSVDIIGDYSERLTAGINRLTYSGLYGGVLVLLLLLLILGWRNALFVLWGIPVTFLLTFAFIDLYGETINEASLFALVLVLGMVVDDAIVVIENIARYLNRGSPPRQAAIRGASEVMWPVITSSLTTIAAFLPLMLLPGTIGEWMKLIPICVSFALVASLFESLMILPSHAADLGKSDPHRHDLPVNRAIRYVASRYRRMMGPLVRYRWVYLPLAFLVLVSSFLVINLVGVDLFEDDEFSLILVRIWMPEGSPIDKTEELASEFQKVAMTLPGKEVKSVSTQVGVLDTDTDRIRGKDVAQVMVQLVEPNFRERDMDQIVAELRERSRRITGHRRVEIKKLPTGPPVGNPVEVKIKGPFFEELETISEEMQAYLAGIPGVSSVQDDLERGKNEIRVRVDKNRAHLVGLDSRDVARQLKYAFDGVPATVYREGDEEIDVVVKFAPRFRDSVEDIYNLKIPTPDGALIPFRNVASFEIERGWAVIRRFQGERAVTVSADVDSSVITGVEVTRMLQDEFADISRRYPEYRLDFRGEFQEFEEAFQGVTRLFLVGVILIYLILGAQFRSFLQPLLVLAAIPFAFAGAMLCLLVNGYHFSINVMFGMVALSGVAVNDSILLIDFINKSRARGASLYRAVLKTSKLRLRPIFLTTVTTVFGLLPMSTGLAGRSVVWMPLAGTIVWGIGVATFLILLVMPPLYAATDDIRNLFTGPPAVPVRDSEVQVLRPAPTAEG